MLKVSATEEPIKELNQKNADILALLQKYQDEKYNDLWAYDARLYRAFAKRLVSEGRLQSALDLLRQGLEQHHDDLELQYLRALAHARAKHRKQTEIRVAELVETVGQNIRIESDAFSLAGKLRKDQIANTQNKGTQIELAREAADFYDRAARLHETAFPIINAATTWLVAGEPEKAHTRAERAIKLIGDTDNTENDHWIDATLGEAKLVLGDSAAALSFYKQAMRKAGQKVGDIAAMRQNVALLKGRVEGPERILEVLKGGQIVLFAGHMIDHPLREDTPRFPNDQALIDAVNKEISKKLNELNAVVGYCSAACGADLLFARQMLNRGAELNIVLPFAKDDFITTSVDFGYDEMAFWHREFDDVIAAAEVHYATEDRYLGHDVLFGFANTMLQGLAITHANRLNVSPIALVVRDPTSQQHQTGGTGYFRDNWMQQNRRLVTIDLATLRDYSVTDSATAERPKATAKPQREVLTKEATRRIQTMLFADVKGFSKVREEQAPILSIQFIDMVADTLKRMPDPPEFANTWGDGLFVVFDDVTQGAEFALTLLEEVAEAKWDTLGHDLRPGLRIGIHTGPVYRGRDSIIGRNNYFGRQVNLAARIEPITEVGCVYTSEQFAAALAVRPNHGFTCEYIGRTELAKGAGAIPLYHLQRK